MDDLLERVNRIARNLVGIAQASKRADGTDIPLGQQVREAAALIEAQEAEIRSLREQVEQAAEFICRKCGRRQDGPTDNEARF